MASLDGALGAVAASSGHAAEFLAVTALAEAGDHIVSSSHLYGGTITMFSNTLARFGIETTFVDPTDVDGFAAAIRPETKLLFTETVGNPSGAIADIAALADVAHSNGLPLAIDSTFSTPALCRPVEWGADIVVHSATKFIGGHGTSLGGVVCEAGTFDWGSGRFPNMTEPVPTYNDLRWWDNFGEYSYLTKVRNDHLRDIGSTLAPMHAWLFLQGLETLDYRMAGHVANAQAVAAWLHEDSRVAWVNYAGLPSSPHHDLSNKYLPAGPGAVFTFGLNGGREAGSSFIESLELISHLANVGDAKTLILHPASTTHSQLSDEQMAAGSVTPDMVRISVGLEDLDDILYDLDHALETTHA
jgi:O-acetylhomoserine (thiol)-lyase